MATSSNALVVPVPSQHATNDLASLDIRGAKPPVEIPNGWLWLWITLAVLALAAIGFWLWWRRRQPAVSTAAEVVIPPEVRAREKLRAALALLGQPEPFCVAVSDAVRVYLEERFNLHAPEQTTEEFLDDLQQSALLALSQKRSLADFLMRCDLVKFARYSPGEPELRDLYESAVRLVEETAPSALATAMAAEIPAAVAAAETH